MQLDLPSTPALRLVPLAQLSAKGAWQIELLHDCAHSLLIWLTRGQGAVLQDGTRRGVGVHNLLYFPRHSAWALDLGRQAFGQAIIISPESIMALPRDPVHLRVRSAPHQAELAALLDGLGREQNSGLVHAPEAMSAYGDLISIWIRRQQAEQKAARDTAYRRLMRQYFNALVQNHSADVTMADHAENLGVTPTHLTRVSRAETGKTAAALLTERILHAARSHLTETSAPVKDIAARLGFGSAPYFTRFIRHHTGLSPTTLRRQARSQI